MTVLPEVFAEIKINCLGNTKLGKYFLKGLYWVVTKKLIEKYEIKKNTFLDRN